MSGAGGQGAQEVALDDVDPRLTWMLRVLGDEFGPLGVLRVAAELWPDASWLLEGDIHPGRGPMGDVLGALVEIRDELREQNRANKRAGRR